MFISYSIIGFLVWLFIDPACKTRPSLPSGSYGFTHLVSSLVSHCMERIGNQSVPGNLPSVFPCGWSKSDLVVVDPYGTRCRLLPHSNDFGQTDRQVLFGYFWFWCIAALAPWSVVHHLEGGRFRCGFRHGTVMSIAMIFLLQWPPRTFMHCFSGYLESMERPATEICYFRNHILYFVQLHRRHFSYRTWPKSLNFQSSTISLQPACIRFLV